MLFNQSSHVIRIVARSTSTPLFHLLVEIMDIRNVWCYAEMLDDSIIQRKNSIHKPQYSAASELYIHLITVSQLQHTSQCSKRVCSPALHYRVL